MKSIKFIGNPMRVSDRRASELSVLNSVTHWNPSYAGDATHGEEQEGEEVQHQRGIHHGQQGDQGPLPPQPAQPCRTHGMGYSAILLLHLIFHRRVDKRLVCLNSKTINLSFICRKYYSTLN